MLVSDLVPMVLIRTGHLYLDDLSYLSVKDYQFLEIVKDSIRTSRKYQHLSKNLLLLDEHFEGTSADRTYLFNPTRDVIIPDNIVDVHDQDNRVIEFYYDKPLLRVFNSTLYNGCLLVEAAIKYNVRKLSDAELPETLQPEYCPAPSNSNPQGFESSLPILDVQVSNQKISGISPPTDKKDSEFDLRTWNVDFLDDPSSMSLQNVDSDMGNSFDLFLDMLTAKFMISVGRSRGQFALRESPVEVSWSEMVNEGKELLESTQEKLATNFNPFHDMLQAPRLS